MEILVCGFALETFLITVTKYLTKERKKERESKRNLVEGGFIWAHSWEDHSLSWLGGHNMGPVWFVVQTKKQRTENTIRLISHPL